MDNLVSQFILYRDLEENSILLGLADIIRDYKREKNAGTLKAAQNGILRRINHEIKKLLALGSEYDFDENLWHAYLTWILLMNQNTFSLIVERNEDLGEGTATRFAKHDFQVFQDLFHYDFTSLDADLEIDYFHSLTNYQSFRKHERSYNKNVGDMIFSMQRKLAKAQDVTEFTEIIMGHYRKYGVGTIGLNRAFRIKSGGEKGPTLMPIYNTDKVMLDDLIGYESQKEQLRANTEAFLEGRTANNALLYGDAGTGKSSSVKALINEYYDQGLRMIEIYKYQFRDLSNIIAQIKNRNYRFIIFIDDLSFEENEVEYKFLKAVIEGGVETRPDNVRIYATSNRRNLIRETWKDRADMEVENDVHHSDTLEEKLSLSARFGCRIGYYIPRKRDYDAMVLELAQRAGIDMPEEELLLAANRWEIAHGGVSGRTAQQFIDSLGYKKAD